jgi:hypothetical protein
VLVAKDRYLHLACHIAVVYAEPEKEFYRAEHVEWSKVMDNNEAKS